jgi:hypothetical protein
MKKQQFHQLNKKILLTGLALSGGLAYYLLLVHFNIGIPCLFNVITNLKCPGCGITHLILNLSKFKFRQAFLCNQFIFITSPFIIYFIIKNYLCWLLNITFKLNKVENILIILLLIDSIIFTIARNII